MNDFIIRHHTRKEVRDRYLNERPYSSLEKMERWIIAHSFVFMWLPIITAIELLYNIPIFPLPFVIALANLCLLFTYGLLLPAVFLLSWDGHFKRNLSWYADNVIGNFDKKRHGIKLYIPFFSFMKNIPRSFIIRAIALWSAMDTHNNDETRAKEILGTFRRTIGMPDVGYGVCSSCLSLNKTAGEFKDIILYCVTYNKPYTCPNCGFDNRFHTMFAVKGK